MSKEARARTLTILSGHWDLSQLKEVELSNTDVLAFDLPAMQACRFSGMSFLTPADFYPSHIFRRSFADRVREIELLFENLDREYLREIAYPHAFRSNIYFFLSYFAQLHYFRGLAQAIVQHYSVTQMLTTAGEGIGIEQSRAMTAHIFADQVYKEANMLEYNLRSLWKALDRPTFVRAPRTKDHLRQRVLVKLYRRYGYLLQPANWGMLFEKLRARFSVEVDEPKGRKIIWCIQDGFDVAPLKKYLPNFAFLNPITRLKEKARSLPGNVVRPIFNTVATALSEFYPQWRAEISALLKSYHEGVVCRIPVAAEMITEQIKNDSPRCALYSIGAATPLEGLYGWVLNQHNIPIYSFQHGYSDNLYFTTPLNNYYEFNVDLDQTNILVSKLEKDLRQGRNPGSSRFVHTDVAAGSIRLFEWHQASGKRFQRAGNGRVLYVQGRYPSEAWKNLFCSEGEDLLFAKHEQIFDLIAKYDLPLDIKLYPGPAKYYAPYFQRLIERSGIKHARLLYDVPAEVVAPNYSLIIVEYIGSALNAFFMALDRPIVYYLAERDLVNRAIAHDFYRRHYVAHDGKELEEVLCSYAQGRLASKYSSDYVDKYVYPLQSGNPGIRIAQMLGQGVD